MQPTIVRNTLISRQGLDHLLALPAEDIVYVSLLEILTKFQDIKKFASEIHTEIHLVMPVLKILGYAYESKPKYFEEYIKDPDVALFASEQQRESTSRLWGTREYYSNTLGVLILKRFGRKLEEGISGFFLEFENRIPIYQLFYFLKNTKTPWGILTNGKQWILMKRPISCEMRVFCIDLEEAIEQNDRDALHLFCKIFSLGGLTRSLPDLQENERESLLERLKEKKASIRRSIEGFKKKTDVFPRIISGLSDLFAEKTFSITENYLKENEVKLPDRPAASAGSVDDFNLADISSYLLNKKGVPPPVDLERVFLMSKAGGMTKEQLLSLKILDMTPGFGNITTELIDSIAYFSFVLPYRDRNTFVSAWEEERSLKRFIIDRILHGIEKSHIAYDILHSMMENRYGTDGVNFKFGNPLIGMSLADLAPHVDIKNQPGLFSKNPLDLITDLRQMYRQYFSLSEKIREDMVIREELGARLARYRQRLRDVMDLITATYFSKAVDEKKIQEALSMLDGDGDSWRALSSKDWFFESKRIARRNGFFHLEIEFPFLINESFDHIFVQPSLAHIWEDTFPLSEVTKAYVKRGMTYLKPEGVMVIVFEKADDDLIEDLSRSKRYETQTHDNMVILTKKTVSTVSAV